MRQALEQRRSDLFSSMRFLVAIALLATIALLPVARGQQVTQVAGVENTNMGTYRALAQLSFDAFEKGHFPMAAKFARILERAWDKGEEGDGRFALEKLNPSLFKEIDDAMDGFIKPIIASDKVHANRTDVAKAYKEYIGKLELGDKVLR